MQSIQVALTYEQLPKLIIRNIPLKEKIIPPFKMRLKPSKEQAQNMMGEIKTKNPEEIKINMQWRKTVESQKEVEKLFLMLFLKELILYQTSER